MDFLFNTKTAHTQFFSIVFTLCLLISFGLHSFQVQHTHYVAHNDHEHHSSGKISLVEYMHVADKKVFLIPILLAVFIVSFLDTAFLAWRGMLQFAVRRCVGITETTFERYQLFNYYNLFFKKGILHSKAY